MCSLQAHFAKAISYELAGFLQNFLATRLLIVLNCCLRIRRQQFLRFLITAFGDELPYCIGDCC